MRLDDFRPCHFDHVRPFKTVIIDLFGFQGVMSTILDPGTFYPLSFLILDPILDLWKRSEIKFLGYLCSSWEDVDSIGFEIDLRFDEMDFWVFEISYIWWNKTVS